MTERGWLTSADPAAMVNWLTVAHAGRPLASDRKWYLFAAACAARRAYPEHGREAEGHYEAAAEDATALGTPAVSPLLMVAAWAHPETTRVGGAGMAALLRCIFGNPFRPVTLLVCPDCGGGGQLYEDATTVGGSEPCPHCEGDGATRPWRTPTIRALAAGIYAERAFDRLPVLADALEEAGCTEAALLGHCREPGPHVRGCWAVDLLLGKR